MSDSEDNPSGAQTETGTTTIEQGGESQDTVKDNPTGTDEQSHLLNFSSVEKLSEGYKEIQSHSTKVSQENADLRGKMEAMEVATRLADVERSLKTTQRGRDADSNKAQQDADALAQQKFREDLVEEGDIGRLYDSMNESLYTQRQSNAEEAKGLRDELATLKSEMNGQMASNLLKSSPDWQQHSTEIEALKKEPGFSDLDDSMLLSIAKKMKGDAPDNELGSMPPGTGGSPVATSRTEEPQGFTDEMKYKLENLMSYTPEQIEKMEVAHKEKQRRAI